MDRELPTQPEPTEIAVRPFKLDRDDIVVILQEAGYGVVEGADEVRKKIKEIGEYDRLSCKNDTIASPSTYPRGNYTGSK